MKVPLNWLSDYVKINKSPKEIANSFTALGLMLDKPIGENQVLDLEHRMDRSDWLSIIGCARDLAAFENEKLLIPKLRHKSAKTPHKNQLIPITVNCPEVRRFTTRIFRGVKIAKSPNWLIERLTAYGIQSINNVVDISNYLMLTLGQPVHIFDFEKIADGNNVRMIMREAKTGEKIVTLDDKEIVLPGEDIIIEDGKKRLIDLCGIMGGLNSCVAQNTKTIILFVQTYNKAKIRKTAMTTGVRTLAATYFEKGLDEERVEPTLVYGVKLLQQYGKGKIASQLYDIYPAPYKQKKVTTTFSFFKKIVGVDIGKKDIVNILKNLGFQTAVNQQQLTAFIPSYRKYDILIPEDLIEEVARVYGYHKIVDNLPPPGFVEQPAEFHRLFKIVNKIKIFLKHLGLNEVINYSMISKKMIDEWGLDEKKHLQLANSISEEIEYMRITLLPSLCKNIRDNCGKRDILKFFEIAKVYLPKINSLPEEKYKLAIAVNTDYFDLKGILEALINELNIYDNNICNFIDKSSPYEKIFLKNNQATWLIQNNPIAFLGQIKNADKIYMAEVDIEKLIDYFQPLALYRPITPFSVIKLDLTVDKKIPYIEMKRKAIQSSDLLEKIELIDIFENKITLRFYFSSKKRNITEEEAKNELEKIKKSLF